MTTRPACLRAPFVACLAAALAAGCGGGGGGGGGGPGGPQAGGVQFLGFSFRSDVAGQEGVPFDDPPLEDLQAVPPKLGAPLNLTLLFRFDGPPSGPFNQQTLPVFTTSADVTPAALAPPGAQIQAKGSYLLKGNTVEFHPFVPTEPLNIVLSSPPASVPGLLPASVYTARVTVGANALPNLDGPGGEVRLGTTSNPAAYYPTSQDGGAPLVLGTEPADGTTGRYPGPYSNHPYDSALGTFPPGERSLRVTYDVALAPTAANLTGADQDGDGVIEPSFFLRTRATRLLLSLQVPAGASFQPTGAAFPALAGLQLEPGGSEWQAWRPVQADGSDIFLHNDTGGALPGPDASLASAPIALASGADASLVWVLFEDPTGNELLSVMDHLLGDPSGADLAPAALDTGLAGLTCLTVLQDGRLVGYDAATARIHELIPTVVRSRPSGEPVLTDLRLGDGSPGGGFRSDPIAGLDIVDLAQAPSGALFALVADGGSSIVGLHPIDADLDDVFDAQDGQPTGALLWSGADLYADMAFIAERELLALNRTADALDRIHLDSAAVVTVASDLGAYGVDLGGGPSPVRALGFGWMDLDVRVALEKNDASGALVRLDPMGVLPVGRTLTLMQRQALAALDGTSLSNADPDQPRSVLGSVKVLQMSTSLPDFGTGTPDPLAVIDDVLDEEFEDKIYENPSNGSLSPLAEWAANDLGGQASGFLRASVGVTATTTLGDFMPVAKPNFNPVKAFQSQSASASAGWKTVFLDTNAQNFPLAGGATPGVTEATTVFGGHFRFRNFIIPEGVWVIARGQNPLVITATGDVRIEGILDVSGSNGIGDDTFDTGFTPVPGGLGGPGGGRGGDAHPSLWNTSAKKLINQYVTPEAAEQGWGPAASPSGALIYRQVGGRGGLSTAGYQPRQPTDPSKADHMFPRVPNGNNNEFHRPPGGGGGSFFSRGVQAHNGAGDWLVQSNSSWAPFSNCPSNDFLTMSLYGNEEHRLQGLLPNAFLQCVYRTFQPLKPGGLPGDLVFGDGNPANDFIGPGGELQVLMGGQGGGGGGTRVDSVDRYRWSIDHLGSPSNVPPAAPPYWPKLFLGFYVSATMFDAKGGGGGGGGGGLRIRSFADILVSRTGHIDASGGAGAGGEVVQNSSYAGGGGGGAGGAIILQAAGAITIEADPGHLTPWWRDSDDGDEGAGLNVSGGAGRDARTDPTESFTTAPFKHEFTRSDGGQGGFGLIQLQEGTADGLAEVQQGAFLFARQRAILKRGPFTGDSINYKSENQRWAANPQKDPSSGISPLLRYIDMLHYRSFPYVPGANPSYFYVLNGSNPPLITPDPVVTAGPYQLDTQMIDYRGRKVVREPEPGKIIMPGTYLGWDETKSSTAGLGFYQPWMEKLNADFGIDDPPQRPGSAPGTLYPSDADIPLSILLNEPDGTPLEVDLGGQVQFDPANIVDRLPVIHPSRTPPPFGEVSRARSLWLDFNGPSLRARDGAGLAPPFFAGGFHGTYNALAGSVPPGLDGQVILGAPVPGASAHAKFVSNTPPFDPKLPGHPTQPFNDVKVDAPELSMENVLTDNATVTVSFQGAFPVRSGSSVPDPTSQTAWVSDLRDLSGYPLVRFEVVFDLGANAAFPFGVESRRPAVDRIRLRATY